MVYNGGKHEAIMNFLKPLESHITKKKNKIQVITQNGATAIDPIKWLSKDTRIGLKFFSQAGLLATYEIQTNMA